MNGEDTNFSLTVTSPIDKTPNGGRGNEIYLQKCNCIRGKKKKNKKTSFITPLYRTYNSKIITERRQS